MSERSKKSFVLISVLGVIALVFTMLFSSAFSTPTFALGSSVTPTYSSCASIHFGMEDAADYSYGIAKTYDVTSNKDTAFNNGKSAVVSGVTITDVEVTNTYMGSTVKAYPFKCGKTKGVSSLTITFAESIVGCTLYLLSYSEDVTVTVNDIYSVLIENKLSESLPTKQGSAIDCTYLPYRFNFSSTNELKLTTDKGRYLIGDIALRVA